jgi:hypothetical protein
MSLDGNGNGVEQNQEDESKLSILSHNTISMYSSSVVNCGEKTSHKLFASILFKITSS